MPRELSMLVTIELRVRAFRERVVLSGGQLRAGARRDGGHVVRARLPIGGAA